MAFTGAAQRLLMSYCSRIITDYCCTLYCIVITKRMIDIKKVRPCKNAYFDGELDDGRLVEFKAKAPRKFDNIVRQIVTMSNTFGGFIIFGVDERTRSFIGIGKCHEKLIKDLESSIRELSVGITYEISHEVVDRRDVIILEIKKALTTTYFCREKTTPARQIAYQCSEIDSQTVISKIEMRYKKVYKYMTLEAFLLSLYRGSWRFFEPSKWNDKFEQRFYCANYTLPNAKGHTPQLFATCVTRAKNSKAAWKVYSNGQGLGAHCLQLELDIVELRKQLRASKFRFEEKLIDYEPENIILNLHKKRNKYYKKYFSAFTLDSFLNLLSLKRDAYSYEKELRLFVIPENGGKRNICKKAQYEDLDIKWRDVISKVRIDKKCSDAELVSIQRACISAGINPVIQNYAFTVNTVSSNNLKDVEFERYDIDDMPGLSRITIA